MLIHTQMHTGITILQNSFPCRYRDVSEADRVGSALDAEVFLTGTLPLNLHGLLANGDKLFILLLFSVCSPRLCCFFFFLKRKTNKKKGNTPTAAVLLYGLPIVCSVTSLMQVK